MQSVSTDCTQQTGHKPTCTGQYAYQRSSGIHPQRSDKHVLVQRQASPSVQKSTRAAFGLVICPLSCRNASGFDKRLEEKTGCKHIHRAVPPCMQIINDSPWTAGWCNTGCCFIALLPQGGAAEVLLLTSQQHCSCTHILFDVAWCASASLLAGPHHHCSLPNTSRQVSIHMLKLL